MHASHELMDVAVLLGPVDDAANKMDENEII